MGAWCDNECKGSYIFGLDKEKGVKSCLSTPLFYFILKSASNLNGNLNCSKELEHYAS